MDRPKDHSPTRYLAARAARPLTLNRCPQASFAVVYKGYPDGDQPAPVSFPVPVFGLRRPAVAGFRRRNLGGRRGNCWDNAVAASFFGTFRNELIDRKQWLAQESVREVTSEYIEAFRN